MDGRNEPHVRQVYKDGRKETEESMHVKFETWVKSGECGNVAPWVLMEKIGEEWRFVGCIDVLHVNNTVDVGCFITRDYLNSQLSCEMFNHIKSKYLSNPILIANYLAQSTIDITFSPHNIQMAWIVLNFGIPLAYIKRGIVTENGDAHKVVVRVPLGKIQQSQYWKRIQVAKDLLNNWFRLVARLFEHTPVIDESNN